MRRPPMLLLDRAQPSPLSADAPSPRSHRPHPDADDHAPSDRVSIEPEEEPRPTTLPTNPAILTVWASHAPLSLLVLSILSLSPCSEPMVVALRPPSPEPAHAPTAPEQH